MIKVFTHCCITFAICLLSITANGQEKKLNDNSGAPETLVISFVPVDASFPELGDLQPDQSQLDNYSKKVGQWIATHESIFKEQVLSCKDCKRLSTSDTESFGEASVIRLKKVINALGPALQMQIKGHESYYPEMKPGVTPVGEMTFVVSQKDFELIQTHITQP